MVRLALRPGPNDAGDLLLHALPMLARGRIVDADGTPIDADVRFFVQRQADVSPATQRRWLGTLDAPVERLRERGGTAPLLVHRGVAAHATRAAANAQVLDVDLRGRLGAPAAAAEHAPRPPERRRR